MNLGDLLDKFQGLKALVVGDLMLDEYHFGAATRISPEAPVMVIRHARTEHLPGGAANVALNLKALGAKPVLVGVAGRDLDGDSLEACLAASELRSHLLREEGRPTTKKTRIVANEAHQVLRVDFEGNGQIAPSVEDAVLAAIQSEAPAVDVVVISDYLKGVCTHKVADWAIRAAKRAGVPVVVNPKPQSLDAYRGATLVSLNRAEATDAFLPLSLWREAPNTPVTTEEARGYLLSSGIDAVLVTLGGDGMVATGEQSFQVPAPKVEVADPAGAGDTVIATVALGLAAVGFKREVFELAAQTAGCVVRHVGVASPSAEDLAAIRKM